MSKINNLKLEIIVFLSGAVVMILEMAGSRVLAPYVGTSIFVWTGLIGIIMGSLSLGYYVGGKIADSKADYKTLSMILFASAVSILVMNVSKDLILTMIQNGVDDIKIASVWAGFILFFLPSFLLGIVSPYAVKLKLNSLNTSGTTVGNLYAISTAGSIFGTFVSGFFLISYLGTTNILFLLSFVLMLLSLFSHFDSNKYPKILVMLLAVAFMFITAWKLKTADINRKIDVDTLYNRVLIFNDKDFTTTRTVRRMNLGNQYASEMFLDSDELAFQYTNYYNVAPVFKRNITKSLVIGGAAYSYPRDYLVRYPNASVDVVEIDPGLTDLAKKYFRLKDAPRMRIYHEDGRTYLNKTREKYDVIFVDAFNTETSVPFHLTTKEAISKMYSALNDDGIVVINLISALDGAKGGFFNSEYHTYLSVFPKVYVFTVGTRDPEIMQNLVLVATKTDNNPKLESNDPTISGYLGNIWTNQVKSNGIILTDDFSPVERFYKM